jgi:hypothetical protein
VALIVVKTKGVVAEGFSNPTSRCPLEADLACLTTPISGILSCS